MAAAILTLCAMVPAFASGSSPVIYSFSPAMGPVGQTVVINGANFIPPFSVAIGNVEASGSFTSTKITITVPSGATTSPITITTPNGTFTTSSNFVVGGTGTTNANPVIVMSAPLLQNKQALLNFTVTNLTNPTFHLVQTAQLNNMSWTFDSSAVLTTITPNSSYRFTTTANSPLQFYRVVTP